MPTNPPATLQSLPEELLEKILVHAVVPPPHQRESTTALALVSLFPPRPVPPPVPAPGVLLANRTLARIGAPLSLRHAVLDSPAQLRALLALLHTNPPRGALVRSLVLADMFDSAVPELLALCPCIEALDVQLPNDLAGQSDEATTPPTTEALVRALAGLEGIHSFTLRKGAYLTGPWVQAALSALSTTIPRWSTLDTVTLAFKLPTSSSAALSGLVSVLTQSPKIHTVRTCLPSIWNPTLLELSSNPSLTRIVLASSEHTAFSPADAPLNPRSLWFRAARAHPHLFALVCAGSIIAHQRAHTAIGPALILGDECESEPVGIPAARSPAPLSDSRLTRAQSATPLRLS